jgi:plastocyanin domain-containing protein
MKKTILIISIFAIFIIAFAGIFLLMVSPSKNNIPNNKTNLIDELNNQVNLPSIQKITLSFKDYNYYPNTIKVLNGIPVEIALDESIKGCFRTLVIKDFGVRMTSSNINQKIVFTPDKKGTFIFACGMHMGTGTLIVE